MQHEKEKVKIKDTKLGQWLKKNAPKALDVVGDALPDQGVLGIIKNLIDGSPDMSPEQMAEFNKHIETMTELEVRDRESARVRQAEMAKAGRHDILFNVTGSVGLLLFMAAFAVVVFIPIPAQNRDMWHQMLGMIEGTGLTIFAFFFGSSKGSREKDKS